MEISKRVSIVIPAYCEEQVIGAILNELHTTGNYHEIIVVDDGSPDKTAETAKAHGAKVIRHPYNMGNGAAVKTGIRASTGDFIMLMDADGQHPPKIIPEILEYADDYGMVVGERSGDSDSALSRDVANRLFNMYSSYIVGYNVLDLTSGFRLIRADIAKRFVYLLPNGYSYPTTLTIALFRSGFPIKYHPFVSPARIGESKVNPLPDGLRFLLTITRLGILFVPLKIFLPTSLIITTVGGGYTLGLLLFNHRFSGFGGFITTIGFFIFLLGLVSEQIALLRLQHTTSVDVKQYE